MLNAQNLSQIVNSYGYNYTDVISKEKAKYISEASLQKARFLFVQDLTSLYTNRVPCKADVEQLFQKYFGECKK